MAGNVQVVRQKQPAREREPKLVKDTAKKKYFYDYSLLLCVFVIFTVGLLAIYSGTQYIAMVDKDCNYNPRFFFNKQLKYGIAGLAAAIVCSKFDYRLLRNPLVTFCAYFGSLALIASTLIMGIAAKGKSRWLSLGGHSFQPTEVAKIGLILTLAFVIYKMKNQVNDNKVFGCIILAAVIPAFLVGTQNISSCIILIMIAGFMLFVATKKTAFLCGCMALFIAGVASAKPLVRLYVVKTGMTEPSSHYWLRRIFAWAAPEVFEDDAYQTLQGLYAIGSGGLTGRGIGESIQKYGRIPEIQNDMIFTVICEEFGFVGAAFVLLIYAFILYRIYEIAKNAPDRYGMLICTGVFAHIAVQVILNISVVTGLIPNTGVTLPFVSYGGTALLCTMGEIGLVLSVAHKIHISDNG